MAALGELAAASVAAAWSVSNYLHSLAGQRVGAVSITLLRFPYQVCFLGVLCLLLGTDVGLTRSDACFLVISGLAGNCIGDFLLYMAIGIIGPQTAILILSFSSAFTTMLSYVFLNESLPLQAVVGIGVTILGVARVLLDRSGAILLPGQERPGGRQVIKGICLSLGSAFALACSFIFLKAALRGGMSPLWATFIRTSSSALFFWGVGLVTGWAAIAVRGLRGSPGLGMLLVTATLFSASGMWLSSVAMSRAPAGVVAALIGLQPIMVAVLSAAWRRCRPSWRVISGTLIAFCGTALICLR